MCDPKAWPVETAGANLNKLGRGPSFNETCLIPNLSVLQVH